MTLNEFQSIVSRWLDAEPPRLLKGYAFTRHRLFTLKMAMRYFSCASLEEYIALVAFINETRKRL